jgi:hypothetical protein
VSETPSIPFEQQLWPRLRRAIAILVLVALLVIGGSAGFRYAKLRLALQHAHREFSTRQYMRAEFWTGRALSVEPRNLEATRLMAEIHEAQDRPDGLAWRIRVAQLNPGNPADTMAWAKSALRFGRSDMALGALKSLPPDFKKGSAEYHELMAGCALVGNDLPLAEVNFIRAAELDHENPVHRVNLEAFRLTASASPEARAAAARSLEGELADSRVTIFAIRALLSDALRRGDRARAQRFAEKLRSLPEHNLSDDLSCLETVMSDAAFHPALEAIEQRAEAEPLWIAITADWLRTRGMAAETLRWFAAMPQKAKAETRVQIAAAEAYLALYDWNGLAGYLADCHWNEGEYLRRAMLIRCHRELSQPWEKDWKQLVSEANAHEPEGMLLAQLTLGWEWRDETLDLLWGAAADSKTSPKALHSLWDLYAKANDSRNMLRVAAAQIDLDPSDAVNKNNEAFLSLLLHGASERSERFAREAATANPKVAEWTATYAYALHLGHQDAEAKKAMEKLSTEALQRPGVALYYAIVLAANGEKARAKEALSKLNPSGMLPEEQKLAADLSRQLDVAAR